MTIAQQDLQNKPSGLSIRNSNRSLKKRKVVKPTTENLSPDTSTDEKTSEEEDSGPESTGRGGADAAPAPESLYDAQSSPSIAEVHRPPSAGEKRKAEGNEWKPLKKVDYQRLETVLEEVQPLGEATSSKTIFETQKCVGEPEPNPWEFGHGRVKKPWFYNLMSINEHPELQNGEEVLSEEDSHVEEKHFQENVLKRQLNTDRCDLLEAHGEPVEILSKEFNTKIPQDKRSVILNGMMEILPIFSNDKFVSSRDAISIEDYEELETMEKTLPSSGKFIIDTKTSKENRTIDIKPFQSANSVKKGFKDRLTERHKELKDGAGTRLQCKDQFTEVPLWHSSHFINFLLVLTPFAEERQRMVTTNAECNMVPGKGVSSPQTFMYAGLLRVVYGLILTTVGIISISVGVAWTYYRPPGILDYFLSWIPFIQHRRTAIEVFFDRTFQMVQTLL